MVVIYTANPTSAAFNSAHSSIDTPGSGMLQVGYAGLSFFAKGEDVDMASGGTAATGRNRHQAEGKRPYGPLEHHEPRRAVLFSGDLRPILQSTRKRCRLPVKMAMTSGPSRSCLAGNDVKTPMC